MADKIVAPIFIVSTNKSGSNLLYLILANHEQLSGLRAQTDTIKTEGDALLHLPAHGIAEGHKIAAMPTKLRVSDGPNLFGHDRYIDQYRLTPANVEPGDREAIAAVYLSEMVDPTKRLVEKSPPNILRTRYLQRLFPDATFVCLVRDPRANVAANAKKRTKWGTVLEQAVHWRNCYQTFLDDMPLLKRACIVHYEDITEYIGETFGGLLAYCNLDGIGALRPTVPIERSLNADLIDMLSDRDNEIIEYICRETADRLQAWDMMAPVKARAS